MLTTVALNQCNFCLTAKYMVLRGASAISRVAAPRRLSVEVPLRQDLTASKIPAADQLGLEAQLDLGWRWLVYLGRTFCSLSEVFCSLSEVLDFPWLRGLPAWVSGTINRELG